MISLHPLKSRIEIRTLSFLVILYAGIVLGAGTVLGFDGAEKAGTAKARRSKAKGPTSIML